MGLFDDLFFAFSDVMTDIMENVPDSAKDALYDHLDKIEENGTKFFNSAEEFGDRVFEPLEELGDTCNDIEKHVREATYNVRESICDATSDTIIEPITKSVLQSFDKRENFRQSLGNPGLNFSGERVNKNQLFLGDHLFIKLGIPNKSIFADEDTKTGITHHGVYIGNNQVMHFAPYLNEPIIHAASLEDFAHGNNIYRLSEKESPKIYDCYEIVRRAKSREGENGYNLFTNNCENFVRWCRFGPHDTLI